jgi:hypothetical protein
MNGYFAAGRISEDEKNDILKLHTSVYNGYRTMQPEVKNEQPLYVYDPAQDKVGAVMSNKGVVKPYTNVGINESTEQKEVCDECGSMMMEGECSECGWKGEVGDMDEQWQAAIAPALERMAAGYVADKAIDKVSDMFSANEGEDEDSDSPKSHRKGGKFKRHHYTEAEVSEYETGHLDDIYDESDLNPNSEFDYVKGASNKTNAFHVKEQADDYMDNFEDPDNEDDGFEDINSSEVTDGELDELGTHELEKGRKYKYHTPSFEDEIEFDDEFEDKEGGDKMYKFKGKQALNHLMAGKGVEKFVDYLDEQGYTGGGNAPDMDLSNIDPAYDFVSDGPMAGGDVYPTEGEMDEEECDECWEKMESAWSEEIDEVDVSGVQGIYGAMEPAFDFDSEGPGKAGPYQHSQYESENGETEEQYLPKHVWDDAHKKGHVKTHKELGIDSDDDFDEDELEVDFDEFDPRDKSWEEITAYTGDDEFGGVDEDIKESLILQKNRIMEMMNRMKVIK